MNIIRNYNTDELFNSNYFVNILACYIKEYNDFETRMHAHHHIEIMYIAKGSCTIFMDNKTLHMKKNDIVIINSLTFHKLVVKNHNCKIINLEFQFVDKCSHPCSVSYMIQYSLLARQILNSKNSYFHLKNASNVSSILLQIIERHQVVTKDSEDNNLIIQLKTAELFIVLGELIKNSDVNIHNSHEYVDIAIEYMNKNYSSPIKVQDIARFINIHPTYLQKLFKKEMKCTIVSYLNTIRINYSKQYLLNSKYLITEIPYYVGINSAQYFINLFKKETGMTPLQFRNTQILSFQQTDYADNFVLKSDTSTPK